MINLSEISKIAELNGNLIAAIKMAPKSDWENFFSALEMQQAMRITGTEEKELLALKETIKGIQTLKNKFLAAHDLKVVQT